MTDIQNFHKNELTTFLQVWEKHTEHEVCVHTEMAASFKRMTIDIPAEMHDLMSGDYPAGEFLLERGLQRIIFAPTELYLSPQDFDSDEEAHFIICGIKASLSDYLRRIRKSVGDEYQYHIDQPAIGDLSELKAEHAQVIKALAVENEEALKQLREDQVVVLAEAERKGREDILSIEGELTIHQTEVNDLTMTAIKTRGEILEAKNIEKQAKDDLKKKLDVLRSAATGRQNLTLVGLNDEMDELKDRMSKLKAKISSAQTSLRSIKTCPVKDLVLTDEEMLMFDEPEVAASAEADRIAEESKMVSIKEQKQDGIVKRDLVKKTLIDKQRSVKSDIKALIKEQSDKVKVDKADRKKAMDDLKVDNQRVVDSQQADLDSRWIAYKSTIKRVKSAIRNNANGTKELEKNARKIG